MWLIVVALAPVASSPRLTASAWSTVRYAAAAITASHRFHEFSSRMCADGTDSAEALARQLRQSESELRSMRATAADATNAEARLRNMVATADKQLSKMAEARRAAEQACASATEESDGLRIELEALRTLFAQEVEALEADLLACQTELDARRPASQEDGAAVGASDSSGTDAAMPPAFLSALGGDGSSLKGEAILDGNVASTELNEMSQRALRAEEEASDLRDELDALEQVAAQDQAALAAENAALLERVLAAELAAPGIATSADGVQLKDATARAEVAGLRDQVAALLELVQGQEELQQELMQLRPRLAQAEAELARRTPPAPPGPPAWG